MSIITKTNYLAPIVIYNKKIYEYDMKQGGYSILKKYKQLKDNENKIIKQLSKNERNIYIGKILREKPLLNKVLAEGFLEARILFKEKNNIEDSNIISIKKDAIFINTIAKNLKFEGYKFDLKNTFCFLSILDKKEFYLSYPNKQLMIKGIDSNISNSSEFIKDIKKIFLLILNNNKDYLIRHLMRYRKKYLERELDIECYREFNRDFSFRFSSPSRVYLKQSINEEELEKIDISYNYLNYILPLIKEII